MEEYLVNLRLELEAEVANRELLGTTFRVAPATLVREQVLHNNLGATFLPKEELTPAFASSANGAPVLTDHPTKHGLPISGRTPDVMNALGIGFLFNVRIEDGRMRGDVWLDPRRAEAVSDLTRIFEKLDAGETVELSTGFPARLERTSGIHNGEKYDVVLRPSGFDHLAVFAEKTGACSVDDGCGVGNEAAAGDTPPTEARGVLRRVYAILGLDRAKKDDSKPADEPPGDTSPKEEGQSMNREQMIAALAAVVALSSEELGKLTNCELKALQAAHNGGGDGSGEGDPPAGSDEEKWKERALNYRREKEELERRFASTIENERDERLSLVEDLLHTTRTVAWNAKEIQEMPIEQLRRVHRQVFGREDYSGRGGPSVGNSSGAGFVADFVQPLFGGASDRKEA